MAAKRFLVWFFISLIAFSGLALLLFCVHLGMPWWPHHLNREVRIAKHYIAENVEGPTIWLQGGSSTWFGFDSPLLHSETGYDVVNLAFNINMPTEFCFDEVRRFAKPGDVVILGLENSMYFRNNYSSYAADEITIWAPEFFWSLSLPRKAQFLKSLPWRKVLAGDIVRLGQLTGDYQKQLKPLPSERVIENLEAQWAGSYSGEIPAYYNYLTLNRHGDFIPTNHTLWRETHEYYLMDTHPVSKMTRHDFEEFVQWASENDVQVLMSWIPMAQNPKLDLEHPKAKASIQRISEFTSSLGLDFLGQPEDFVLDIELFYDTSHHTTAEGATERTKRLLPYLKRQLPKPNP